MTTAPATSLLGLQRPGVMVTGVLPDPAWVTRWDDIVVDEGMKQRLLCFGLFCLTQRGALSTVALPVHGLALLSGPPGTGKTTLAHGFANAVATELADRGIAGQTVFAVIDPHAFPSEFLGESQRAVGRLFNDTLPELAGYGHPMIVLVDEAETLAVTRSRASFDTNPVDVHRATDAVLTGVDRLAAEYPNVILVATTNEERTIDDAFLSRVDLHETFALPPFEVVCRILVHTLAQVGVDVPADAPHVVELASACVARGIDPRQVRKLVVQALVGNGVEVALAPGRLRVEHLAAALDTLDQSR
ncbi:MAG: pachytene checkpoint protein 2 [Pseudonocardiales bacterium]|nr:pachytene checkpoint protein 2 [Pseudonocardiales bacterium]